MIFLRSVRSPFMGTTCARLLSSEVQSTRAARLDGRSALLVSGADAGKFLQGLLSQDVLGLQHSVPPVQYAHMLNAKGRTRFDCMIYPSASNEPGSMDYLLEVDRSKLTTVYELLKKHRMRAKVDFQAWEGEWNIWTVSGDSPSMSTPGSRSGPDPRLAGYHRLAVPTDESPPVPVDNGLLDEYTRARVLHGICEGVEELQIDETLPLEHNLDLYNGVCFKKGCYVGQELTTRTHFQGMLRKRALPVHLVSGAASQLELHGQLMSRSADGQTKRAGKLRAWFGDVGIAVVPINLVGTDTVLGTKGDSGNGPVLAISEMSSVLSSAIQATLQASAE